MKERTRGRDQEGKRETNKRWREGRERQHQMQDFRDQHDRYLKRQCDWKVLEVEVYSSEHGCGRTLTCSGMCRAGVCAGAPEPVRWKSGLRVRPVSWDNGDARPFALLLAFGLHEFCLCSGQWRYGWQATYLDEVFGRGGWWSVDARDVRCMFLACERRGHR